MKRGILEKYITKINYLPFYIPILLITILYAPFLFCRLDRNNLFFDYLTLSNQYNNSQIINDTNATTTMYDPQLYQYAGYTYITQGKLDQINIEHPPLGKYLLGLSSIFLGSPIYIQIMFGYVIILSVYFLSYRISKNYLLSLLPVILLFFDRLFIVQINQTELDLPLTALLVLFMYLNANIKLPSTRKAIANGSLLGLASSIKYPSFSIILMFVYFLFLIRKYGKNALKKILFIITVSLATFIIMYAPLITSKGFNTLVQVQVKAFRIHRSHLPDYPKFAALRVIFSNQWPIWFDSTAGKPFPTSVEVSEWTILWPLATFSFAGLMLLWKKSQTEMKLMLAYTFCALLFLNLRLFFPRYLLTILPFLYLCVPILLTYLLQSRLKFVLSDKR